MARSEQGPSRLLSLPGELRNRIYRLTAVHQEPVQVRAACGKMRPGRIAFSPQVPALASTCHMAYSEVKPILFEENMFQFCGLALRANRPQTFREQAGASADKSTAVRMKREYFIGSSLTRGPFITCTVQVTAQATSAGVVLSDRQYYHQHLDRMRGINDYRQDEVGGETCHDPCLRALTEAATASNGNLLAFLERLPKADREEPPEDPLEQETYLMCHK